MNRLISIIGTGLCVITISGCQTTGGKIEAPTIAAPECQWPGTQVAAPIWVCDGPIEGYSSYATGSHKSAAGNSFMKQQAALKARVALANEIKVKVSGMIKNYLGTTGSGDAETIDQAASSTAKSITASTLVGSKIVRSQLSPTGEMFVVVGVDLQAQKEIVKNAVKTSLRNESALLQEFKSQKSHDEMAAAIAEMESK